MNRKDKAAIRRRLYEPGFRLVPVVQASQSRRRRFDPVAVAGWTFALGFALAFWALLIAWVA